MAKTEGPKWLPLERLTYQPTACPICGTNRGRLRFEKRIRDVEMRYWLCPSCDALYADPRATVESLRNLYASADFFAGGTPGGDHLNYHDFVGGERYLRATARDRISRIRRHVPQGRLLEVASAAGFFLIEAKLAGYSVNGVEFSEPLARWASQRWEVDVVSESIERVQLEPEGYDVIVSWGVMTIIQDPVGLMRKFHRALKPGGLWAFNTYYHDGLWPKIVGKRWDILTVNFSQIYSSRLILDLAREAGFELLARRREMPYTDLIKIADKLAQVLGMTWLPPLLQRLGLAELVIKIPLPDVCEYLFRRKP